LLLPEMAAMKIYKEFKQGNPITLLEYKPDAECFFKGEDPFFLVRQISEVHWGVITNGNSASPSEMDAYDCKLTFQIITSTDLAELRELFRYVPEEIRFEEITSALSLIVPTGEHNNEPVYDDFIAQAQTLLAKNDVEALRQLASTMLELSSPQLWCSSALRWLVLVLECDAENHALQQALIESLRTFSIVIDENMNQNISDATQEPKAHKKIEIPTGLSDEEHERLN